MSVPQRHLNLLNKTSKPCRHQIGGSTVQISQIASHKKINDSLSALITEIEAFLRVCSYEEMCNFWEAVTNLRHRLHKSPHSQEVPLFLTGRRQNRDFCRILEVLADLPYPKLHFSDQVNRVSGARRQAKVTGFDAQFHLAMQR